MKYSDLDSNQSRISIDAKQNFDALKSAHFDAMKYAGSMFWREVSGAQYLIIKTGKNTQKSLGVRSSETERIFLDFQSGKLASNKRLESLVEQHGHAKFVVAANINRVPVKNLDLSKQLCSHNSMRWQ